MLVFFGDVYGGSRLDVTIDDKLGNTVLYVVLDGSLQGTGTKLYVVAFLGNKLAGFFTEVDRVAECFDTFVKSFQFDIYNLLDGFQIQLVEGDNLVQSVQELGRELFR